MLNKELFTEDEKAILRNLPEEYRWIARDKDGMIYVYDILPTRLDSRFALKGIWRSLSVFENIFKGVTWENSPICFRDPVLDDEEREYLKNIIRPFLKNVIYIKKAQGTYYENTVRINGKQLNKILFFENIKICCLNEFGVIQTITLPAFKEGTKYIGMESGKEYTLDDLGFTKKEFS